MKRHLLLRPLTALATLLLAGSASATEWHKVEAGSRAADHAARVSVDARSAAEVYWKYARAELQLHGVELQVRNELPVGDHRTVRFTQVYAGLPVLGASAAIHVAPGNRVKVAVLDVARGISVSPVPALGEEVAIKEVETSLGMSLAERPSAALGVFPEEEGPGKLVWAVDVRSTSGGERYLVDAHAGQVVHRRALAVHALGRVYPISATVTPRTEDRELTHLDPSTPQTLSGWNGNLKVANYLRGDSMGEQLVLEQSVVPNSGEDFLYDPPQDALDGKDEFAQVGIYYHLTRMRDYFMSAHQLDMNNPSWKLVAVANMQESGQPLDNAFFSPQGVGAPWNAPNLIAIGQGSEFDFSDDSDVFLHEFTHYVSGNAVGYNEGQLAVTPYGLSPWGGSIDEGISDYFACTVNGDPMLGEASLGRVGAERELSKADKMCPKDLIGQVHEDGKLIGSFAWSLREAVGQERGDKLVWGALTLLTKGASLTDFARGVRTVAEDMAGAGELTAADVSAVEGAIKSRGLDDCDHVLDLTGGKPRSTTMFGLDVLAQGFGGSCGFLRGQVSLQSLFHFKSTPAPGAKGIRFSVDLSAGAGDDLDWSIYVRTGRHVGFTSSGFLPTATKFDYSVENIQQNKGEIVIDETSDPPFDPSQTYFMVIGHENCPVTVATVASSDLGVEPVNEPPAEPEPGTDTPNSGTPDEVLTEEQPAGCACRAAGASTGAPEAPWAGLAGLAMVAGVVLRRRARRG